MKFTDESAPAGGDERGQATVALAGVLALTCMIGLALALVGQAMVHRAESRNGADAVALASSIDDGAADALAQWYRGQGMTVEHDQGFAQVGSGPSQAASWAATSDSIGPAPALVAIVRRAEQLIGIELTSVRWDGLAIHLAEDQASALRRVADSFSLCEAAAATSPDQVTFTLC